MRKFDLLPATTAFSQFSIYHPSFRIPAEEGIESEHVQEVDRQDYAPDQRHPVNKKVVCVREQIDRK